MFWTEAQADEAGGYTAKEGPAFEQFQRPRHGDHLIVSAQDSPDQPILNKNLHGLCDSRRQFTARLNSFEMRDCEASLCKMRGQNIRGGDGVLNCEIDTHTSDRGHRVGCIANAQEPGAIPLP